MIEASNSLENYLDYIRGLSCSRSPTGKWLCCVCRTTPLKEREGTICQSCDRHRQAIQAREPRRSTIRSPIERVLAAVPAWPHVMDVSAFKAAISHPILQKTAEKYELRHGSLLVLGASGSGKTSLCARIVRRLCAAAIESESEPRGSTSHAPAWAMVSTTWTTASEIARVLREHRLGDREEPELIRRSVSANLLVVDELGPEPPHRLGELFDLLDRRYVAGRATLVTSGLTLEAFRERYGDALYRRLTEPGRGFLINVRGPDA